MRTVLLAGEAWWIGPISGGGLEGIVIAKSPPGSVSELQHIIGCNDVWPKADVTVCNVVFKMEATATSGSSRALAYLVVGTLPPFATDIYRVKNGRVRGMRNL